MVAGNHVSLDKLERMADVRFGIDIGDSRGDIEFHDAQILPFPIIELKREKTRKEKCRVDRLAEIEESEEEKDSQASRQQDRKTKFF